MRVVLPLVAVAAFTACAQVDNPNAEVVIPSDYKMSFMEVRNCRSSIDHDLAFVVVRVRAELASIYNSGPYPFPQGALVVKEQYSDSSCRNLTGYSVMRKEAPGYFPAGADWQYYALDAYADVVSNGKQARCASCHAMCGANRDRMCEDP